jgi:putative two-component system response regulator
LLFVKQKRKLLETQAALQEHLKSMEDMVHKKTVEVMHLQNSVLATVVDLVEFRDKYTGGHIVRTQLYMEVLVNEMIRKGIYRDEVSEWDVDSLVSSSKLHDVGKIAVPDNILGKTGKLTTEEFENMKDHVLAGVEIIGRMMDSAEEHDFLRYALSIAGTHHEKWDGSGYPIGLSGNNIPLEGRLMAVADVYDALISVRQYKKAFTHEEACKIIEDGAGVQFDPAIADVFRCVKDEFKRISFDNQNGLK